MSASASTSGPRPRPRPCVCVVCVCSVVGRTHARTHARARARACVRARVGYDSREQPNNCEWAWLRWSPSAKWSSRAPRRRKRNWATPRKMRMQPTRGKSLLHPTQLAYDARSESRSVRARKTRHSTSKPQRTLALRSIVNHRMRRSVSALRCSQVQQPCAPLAGSLQLSARTIVCAAPIRFISAAQRVPALVVCARVCACERVCARQGGCDGRAEV